MTNPPETNDVPRLTLQLDEPSESSKRKALVELRETPENVRNGLQELKRLLEDETDLNIPKTDEKWLLMFLRRCKFYPESARDLIRRYYKLRLKYNEITSILLPLKLKPLYDENVAGVWPHRDQHGRRIVITHQGNETDLNIPKTDEKWLLMFLRRCKFYPESARDLIRHYYKLRLKYNEITSILLPLKLKPLYEENVAGVWPHRDQHGRRIVVTHAGKFWNHHVTTIHESFATGPISSDLFVLEPETQINGIVYILDLEGLCLTQALAYSPHVIKRCLDYMEDTVPLRTKGFHIINQPSIFKPVFAAAKLMFTAKQRNRFFMHGSNYEALHRYISPECLPECYGGKLKMPLTNGAETYAVFSRYEEHFKRAMTYGYKSG